jgi:hypothetical protein
VEQNAIYKQYYVEAVCAEKIYVLLQLDTTAISTKCANRMDAIIAVRYQLAVAGIFPQVMNHVFSSPGTDNDDSDKQSEVANASVR